jgi:flagellar secretion chaperone FliS
MPITVGSMAYLAASPQAYRRGAVLAAGPAELVVILYDGARRFLRQAAAAMRDGEVERAHVTLRHGELIIAHLNTTLDLEQGEVAARLRQLYEFSLRHLNAARMAQDPAMVEAVTELLGELRDAWAKVAAQEPAR